MKSNIFITAGLLFLMACTESEAPKKNKPIGTDNFKPNSYDPYQDRPNDYNGVDIHSGNGNGTNSNRIQVRSSNSNATVSGTIIQVRNLNQSVQLSFILPQSSNSSTLGGSQTNPGSQNDPNSSGNQGTNRFTQISAQPQPQQFMPNTSQGTLTMTLTSQAEAQGRLTVAAQINGSNIQESFSWQIGSGLNGLNNGLQNGIPQIPQGLNNGGIQPYNPMGGMIMGNVLKTFGNMLSQNSQGGLTKFLGPILGSVGGAISQGAALKSAAGNPALQNQLGGPIQLGGQLGGLIGGLQGGGNSGGLSGGTGGIGSNIGSNNFGQNPSTGSGTNNGTNNNSGSNPNSSGTQNGVFNPNNVIQSPQIGG